MTPAILDAVRSSPKDEGVLKLIVLRLPDEKRLTPPRAILSVERGVEGDRWGLGKKPHRLSQVSVMNARYLEAIAGGAERMDLAGDNLIVDLDLQPGNVPPGTRLQVGKAVIEVTDHPHTGCNMFEQRYGKPALDFTNSAEGRALRLRGVYARVVRGGEIHVGDTVHKTAPDA